MKFFSKVILLLILISLGNISITANHIKDHRVMTSVNMKMKANKRSTTHSHSKFKSAKRFTNKNKLRNKSLFKLDPILGFSLALKGILVVGTEVLNYYVSKNYQESVLNLKKTVRKNNLNVDIMNYMEISTCSGVKLLLNLVKFQNFSTELNFLLLNTYEEIKIKAATSSFKTDKDNQLSLAFQTARDLKNQYDIFYKKTITQLSSYSKSACSQIFGDTLRSSNIKLKEEINVLNQKLVESNKNIFHSIQTEIIDKIGQDPFLNTKIDSEMDELEFSNSFHKIRIFNNVEETNSKIVYQQIKVIKEKKNEETANWVKMVVLIIRTLSSLAGEGAKMAPITHRIFFVVLKGALNLLALIIELIFSAYEYITAVDEHKKIEKKKIFYLKLKSFLSGISAIFMEAIFDMFSNSIDLIVKIHELVESISILENSKQTVDFYSRYGELLKKEAIGYNMYSMCGAKYTFAEYFLKANIDMFENFSKTSGLKEEVTIKIILEEIMKNESSKAIISKKIREDLCNNNIQFCSRTFNASIMQFFTPEETDELKYIAIYGPFTDFVTTNNSEITDGFIKLGYEPVKMYSKEINDGKELNILGCRVCSKKIIRHVELHDFHDDKHHLFGKKNNCNEIKDKHCFGIYNDNISQGNSCRSSKDDIKSIRISLTEKNSILMYEKINPDEGEGHALALHKLNIFYSNDKSQMEILPYKAVYHNKKLHNCDSLKNFKFNKEIYCAINDVCLMNAPILPNIISSENNKLKLTCNKIEFPRDVYMIIDNYLLFNYPSAKSLKSEEYGSLKHLCYMTTSDSIVKYDFFTKSEDGFSYANFEYGGDKISTNKTTIINTFINNFEFNARNYYELKPNSYNWISFDIKGKLIIEYYVNTKTINNKDDEITETTQPRIYSNKIKLENKAISPFANEEIKIISKDTKDTKEDISSVKEFNPFDICDNICHQNDQICLFQNSNFNENFPKSENVLNSVKLSKNTAIIMPDSNKDITQVWTVYNITTNLSDFDCLIFDKKSLKIDLEKSKCDFTDTKIPLKDLDTSFILFTHVDKKKDLSEDKIEFLKKGYIRYKKFDFKSDNNIKIKFYFKPLPSLGILPFKDHNHVINSLFYNCHKWINTNFFNEMEFKNNNNKLSGNSLEKLLFLNENHHKELKSLKLEYFFNPETYNNVSTQCRSLNVFVPLKFSKKGEKDNIYDKLIVSDNKYQEINESFGPGMRNIYWLQIAFSLDYNDTKFNSHYRNSENLTIGNSQGFIPIREVSLKIENNLEVKIIPWVQFDYRLSEDKKSFCELCYQKEKEVCLKNEGNTSNDQRLKFCN